MRHTVRALWSTELMKLRHTAVVWMSVGFPAVLLLLELIALIESHYEWTPHPPRTPIVEWQNALRPWWTMWTVAAVPILISLQAVGLVSPEHSGKHWKQLYVLPIPRWNIFAAKTALCALLTAVSFLIFSSGSFGLALLRSGLFHLDMTTAIPWGSILQMAGRTYLACLAVIAIQTWLSMRFSGFAIPLGVGLAGTMAAAIFRKPLDLAGWWPWTMPADSLTFGMDHVPTSALVSPLAFVVFVVIASRLLSRREVIQ